MFRSCKENCGICKATTPKAAPTPKVAPTPKAPPKPKQKEVCILNKYKSYN